MDPQEVVADIRRLGADGAAQVLPRLVLAEVTEIHGTDALVKVRRQEETSASGGWCPHLKTYSPEVGDIVVALAHRGTLYVLGDI